MQTCTQIMHDFVQQVLRMNCITDQCRNSKLFASNIDEISKDTLSDDYECWQNPKTKHDARHTFNELTTTTSEVQTPSSRRILLPGIQATSTSLLPTTPRLVLRSILLHPCLHPLLRLLRMPRHCLFVLQQFLHAIWLGHVRALLHRRPRPHAVFPLFERGEVVDLDACPARG